MDSESYYKNKLERFSDKEDRIFDRPDVPYNTEKVHITAVCGKAMAPLAGLLTDKGFEVTGSDKECHPPMSDVLEKLGVKILSYNKSNVKNADVVVVGNSCKPSNPEAKYARENNIPQLSISEALQKFVMNDRTRLVVAGTHGKTTTTGLLAHIFEIAGKDPGFSIGGTMQHKEETFALGSGKHFIIEGDEYDTSYFDKSPKFLSYKAYGAIVTSVEYDHVDIYHDFDDYKQAFKFFVSDLPEDGNLVIWGDDENVLELKDETSARVYTYGFDKKNRYRILNLEQGDGKQTFTLELDGEELGEITTPMSGKHNILNIVGAVGLALAYGLNFKDVQKAVASFGGMIKRQEVIYNKDVTVIDDYAHHPTSVEVTLDGLKKHYPGRRTVVLFEPRSNTCRRKKFEKDFGKALAGADIVLTKQPPQQDGDPDDDFITTQNIADFLSGGGKEVYNFDNTDSMIEKAVSLIQKDDLIIIMTNTSFDDAQGKLINKLDK